VNTFVYDEGVTDALAGWRTSWFIFAGYAFVLLVLFGIIFRPKRPLTRPTDTLSPKGEGKVSI
jgi:NHS family nucleoside permease-like MFS transporter/NHS family xanthosine MFS transporter